MVSTAIIGARGYLGRELVRILDAHPRVDDLVLVSLSGADGPLGASVSAFAHRPDLVLAGPDDPAVGSADVVFLATAPGEAKAYVDALAPADDRLVIDLSRDHRLTALHHQPQAMQMVAGAKGTSVGEAGPQWVYGLPETMLAPRRGDRRIANPGCYPTASLLALLPAVTSGLAAAGPLIVDGKSGASGAGATPRADLHYTEMNENVRAYKVIGHDHGAEIQAAVARVNGGIGSDGKPATARTVRFTPHIVPMNRGLLATCYIPLAPTAEPEDVRPAYEAAYEDAESVLLVDEPGTAAVARTNRAEVAVDVDPQARIIVARAAIDNLVKGGSGQAVHNMNLSLGFDPMLGLPMLGGGP